MEILTNIFFGWIKYSNEISAGLKIYTLIKYYKIYSDPNIFDEGFDEDSYIANRTEDKKFGI